MATPWLESAMTSESITSVNSSIIAAVLAGSTRRRQVIAQKFDARNLQLLVLGLKAAEKSCDPGPDSCALLAEHGDGHEPGGAA